MDKSGKLPSISKLSLPPSSVSDTARHMTGSLIWIPRGGLLAIPFYWIPLSCTVWRVPSYRVDIMLEYSSGGCQSPEWWRSQISGPTF